MKKRIITIILLSFVTTLLLINSYLGIVNDTTLTDYLRQPKKISKEQRAWLQEHGTIIYGSDNNSPPLRYVDEETGEYTGIVVDYLRALSIEIGMEITYVPLIWADALDALEEGRTDISDMYPSEDRAKKYLFTEPIYNQKAVILVSASEGTIAQTADLSNRRVALQKGDYVHEFLQKKAEDISYIFVPDYASGIELLLEGEVDAVVGDEPVISYFIDKMGLKGQCRIIDKAIYERESILAVPKDHKELVSILNYGIAALNKKNTMEKIHQKWFGISAPFIKEHTSEKILLISLFFLCLIFLSFYLFYSWNNQLKKEVARRTRELFISRNDLETTFDGLIHLMIVLDEEYRIVNANSSFCKLMRTEKKAVLGRNYRDFPGILYSYEISGIIGQTFGEGKNGQLEYEYNGKIYEMSTFPLNDYNLPDIQRGLVMIKDVTRIRISDQKILQSNKMSAIGHLAAGVAHEIRNPLGLIRSYCYVLKKSSSGDREKFDKSIRIIESSVEKASNIIENLLDFSRISDNKREIVNIRDLISGIFKLEYKVIAKRNIREEILCEREIECAVNRESLKHILINIISNAVDAMPDGGTIKVSGEIREDFLHIRCEDTGSGINSDDIEKIFNPFFTTKLPGDGTGLGLYVTYNEVQKLGGDIRVRSDYLKGTVFDISIPIGEYSA